jgi:hypothetical protein
MAGGAELIFLNQTSSVFWSISKNGRFFHWILCPVLGGGFRFGHFFELSPARKFSKLPA